MNGFLPYSRHFLDEDDVAAVSEVLRSDWLTAGPATERFEIAFAEAVGAKHAVACSNGTAALHLAMLAAGIGPGDRVVVPAMTFAATANAVRLAGAEVIFADVDAVTGLLTPDTLDSALSRAPDARAIVPVHLNGQCCDLAALHDVSGDRMLILDAAHALGARHRWFTGEEKVGAGRWARMTTFSLHPVKTLTCGEGGVVTTDDPELAWRLRLFSAHGIERDPGRFTMTDQAFGSDGVRNSWYYEQQVLGLNYRLSDIQSALALSQLAKLEDLVSRRRLLAGRYDELIGEALPSVLAVGRSGAGESAWHLYPVFIGFEAHGTTRGELMERLRHRGIGTQVHYLPVYRHPYYRERYGVLSLPGAESYYRQVLSLPLFPGMAEEDVSRVVQALAEAL